LPRDRVTIEGLGLVTGIFEPLQLVATSKDYTLTVLTPSQATVGHTRSSQSVRDFISCCLVAAPNCIRSPASGFPYRPHLTTVRQQLSHYLIILPTPLPDHAYNFRHGTRRKRHSSVALQSLRSHLVLEPLPSNSCCVIAYFVTVA
jgi:hypothetical protein